MKTASFYQHLETVIDRLNSVSAPEFRDHESIRGFCEGIEQLSNDCVIEANSLADTADFGRAHEASALAARLTAAAEAALRRWKSEMREEQSELGASLDREAELLRVATAFLSAVAELR